MWDFLVKGGPLMWPILLCSIWALAVIAERGWTFSRAKKFIVEPLRNASGHVLAAEREKAVEAKSIINDPVGELISIGTGELYAGTGRDEKERRMTRL
ncbi:MAG: MotA/TolQ/ExbB proton channel family protein, partial [Spirochaetota bacterium]